MYQFSTSMMCADPFELKKTIAIIDAHTDYYHIDIMDGHFVPNLTLSLDFVRSLKKHATKPIDVHLMVTDPESYVDELIEIGVHCISFHLSTIERYAFRIVNKVKDAGIKVGFAISPSTRIEDHEILLPKIDKITLMTVEPGFAGQKMITEVLPKIKQVSALKKEFDYSYSIEIDGSNNFKTFDIYKECGAEIFILGTGLFNYSDLNQGYREIKNFVLKTETQKEYVVGMDIGGTFTRFGLVDKDGNISEVKKVPTNELLDDLNTAVKNYVFSVKDAYSLVAIAMGFPGIVDPITLEVISVPNQRKLEGKDYLNRLSQELKLPIYVQKDTAFLFTHDIHGLHLENVPSVLGFYLGTGFGNAIQIDHRIITGDYGSAGEIGHIPMHQAHDVCGCGSVGCVETLTSGVKLKRIHEQHFADTPFEQLFTLHSENPLVKEFIHNFAMAIAIEINLLDVTQIIVGGGVVNMVDFPRTSLEQEIKGFLRNDVARATFNVSYATSAVENGIIGAGIYAFSKLGGNS